MNVKKFQLELMRAILRSSRLEYDDAYQMVRELSVQIVPVIDRVERNVQAREQKELEDKINELKKLSARSVPNQST